MNTPSSPVPPTVQTTPALDRSSPSVSGAGNNSDEVK